MFDWHNWLTPFTILTLSLYCLLTLYKSRVQGRALATLTRYYRMTAPYNTALNWLISGGTHSLVADRETVAEPGMVFLPVLGLNSSLLLVRNADYVVVPEIDTGTYKVYVMPVAISPCIVPVGVLRELALHLGFHARIVQPAGTQGNWYVPHGDVQIEPLEYRDADDDEDAIFESAVNTPVHPDTAAFLHAPISEPSPIRRRLRFRKQ